MNFNLFSQIVRSYQDAGAPFADAITPYLLALLAGGFALQATWDLIIWGIQDKPLFAYALRKALVFSVMFFLIANFETWLPLIVRTFTFLGAEVTGLDFFSPEAVFVQGLALAIEVYLSWGNIFTRFIPGLAGLAETGFLLIVAAFGLIAIQMTRTLVEAAIALSGGAIFLGFAGLKATWSLAEGYLKYLVEIGVRFYVLFMMVEIGKNFARDWANQLSLAPDFNPVIQFTALVATASFAFIVWVLPNKMAKAISGGFNLGGNPLADR